VVIGHGFGLNLSTMAEIMIGATSNNVLPGLECVGPLKVTDTVTNEQIDISSGEMTLAEKIGVGMTLDESKLSKYALKAL
jgi:L-alanine-DL-glutamate epimerase-like enolase superfamily enzyme